jgi:hypothetical protein
MQYNTSTTIAPTSDNEKIRQELKKWESLDKWLCVEEIIRYSGVTQGAQSVGRFMRRLCQSGYAISRVRSGKQYNEYKFRD